nr:hypothetical protein [Tanacetum cinerariifolium]
MSLTFADTHNMVAYLNKSDASEGFSQVIDFLNGSYIQYALTVNPTIYVSCIKQFWNTVAIKQSNDATRLQALVDRKKVVITKAAIRDVLSLDDAEGVDCLPNEEIFAELARMGYEKPFIKLTFYKAFFSSQWKFLIYTILQSMSAKRTSWNEFSSAMATAVICLSTGQKFNFSKYIFKSLVRNVDNSSKFYMYPRVETPLFEGMLVVGEPKEQGDLEEQVQGNDNDAAQGADTAVSGDDVQDQSIPSPTPHTPPPQQPQDIPSTSQVQPQSPPPQPQSLPLAQPYAVDFPMTQALEITMLKKRVKKLEKANKVKVLKLKRLKKVVGDKQVKRRQAEIYQIDMDHASKVLSMQEDEPEVQKVVEVVATAKLITEVIAAVSESVSAASATIAVVPAATITAAPVRVVVASTRRRKAVVIRDPEEESTAKTPTETKSKDKGKGIMRYQVMKKRPQTEAQARRNMIMYLKNVDGFRLDYLKGMSYDDIRLIFEAKFNSNIEFLLKSKEQIEEEENKAIKSTNETLAQKAAKRRKLNEEVEDLKQHLEIVPDEDDYVYIEATPLARKLIFLVERRYPLLRFTLDQLLNAVRLRMEKQAEMSLELIRFTRQQLQEG